MSPSTSSTGTGLQEPEAKRRKLDTDSALQAYRELLEAEVKSTRTKWADFLKAHKRDRRFLNYGRSDREREKAFKDWLVELGERKRELQLRAEDDFLRLLDAQLDAPSRSTLRSKLEAAGSSPEERKAAGQAAWAEAKKTPGVETDPRYEAVGSSTRRAELFIEWAQGKQARAESKTASSSSAHTVKPQLLEPPELKDGSKLDREEDAEEARKRQKAVEAERALKAREEQVRRERAQAEDRQRRVLKKATHAEDVIAFKQMLIDYVKDPIMTFDQLADTLGRSDRRFDASTLRMHEKEDMLHEHLRTLLARRRNALRSIFAKVAPNLATDREIALPLVREEDEWERAELGRLVWGEKEQDEEAWRSRRAIRESDWRGLESLDREWKQWDSERKEKAKREFEEMLKENAFVEFWGRLKHHKQTHDPNAPPAEDVDSDDEDAVGMLEMARQIDLGEIDAVLQADARYRAWKHEPELRESWIREHMERLAVPKQTIHRTGLST